MKSCIDCQYFILYLGRNAEYGMGYVNDAIPGQTTCLAGKFDVAPSDIENIGDNEEDHTNGFRQIIEQAKSCELYEVINES